jgi:hypothetical protein
MKNKRKLSVAIRDTSAAEISRQTGIAASTIIAYAKRTDRTYWVGDSDSGKRVVGCNVGWRYVAPQVQKPGKRKRSY